MREQREPGAHAAEEAATGALQGPTTQLSAINVDDRPAAYLAREGAARGAGRRFQAHSRDHSVQLAEVDPGRRADRGGVGRRRNAALSVCARAFCRQTFKQRLCRRRLHVTESADLQRRLRPGDGLKQCFGTQTFRNLFYAG